MAVRARLLHQHADVVRLGAGDWHRGRRRYRGGGERRAQYGTGAGSARGCSPGNERGVRADRGDSAGAVRGVRSDGLPLRRYRTVLQAVRGDNCHFHRDLSCQLADAVASVGREIAEGSSRAERCPGAWDRACIRLVVRAVQSFLQSQFGSLSRHGGAHFEPARRDICHLCGVVDCDRIPVPHGAERFRSHPG